jgi:hypothetical protein
MNEEQIPFHREGAKGAKESQTQLSQLRALGVFAVESLSADFRLLQSGRRRRDDRCWIEGRLFEFNTTNAHDPSRTSRILHRQIRPQSRAADPFNPLRPPPAISDGC